MNKFNRDSNVYLEHTDSFMGNGRLYASPVTLSFVGKIKELLIV